MGIYIIIVLAIVLIAVAFHFYQIQKQTSLKTNGLKNVSELKLLISDLQTHRGLSSAWLNGDESKKTILLSLQHTISTKINYLELQNSINSSNRWKSFIDHWGRLSKSDTNREPENNFTQHTQIISNLLYLLEDEAEFSHLNAIAIPELPNIGFVWRELAVTAEKIGQSRAIGTGVTTRKNCSSVHKIRLSFLKQHIEEMMNETLSKLSCIDCFSHEHVGLLKDAKLKMEYLTLTMQHDLIEADEITINQNEYFNLATNAISALDLIFEHQVKQIKHTIS